MPTLYLVATPIGNLEDITLRALRTLREVTLIAAEDTRTTGRLLHHFSIETPLISYHEHSGANRIDDVVARLAQGDIALVTDAGMPSVSDPGYRLVRAAIEAGHTISPIPGPNAAIAAIASSGLPTDSFLFLGFLPRQATARQNALQAVGSLSHTLIVYESPHRLLKMLADVEQQLGDREVAVCRELTKLYEEIWRGPASKAYAHFGAADRIRGELTVVIAGATQTQAVWDEAEVRTALAAQLAQGMRRKEAANLIAEQAGWRKKQVYNLVLDGE